MATTSIAYTAAKRVIDLASVMLDETLCTVGWPGDRELVSEMLWVEDIGVETEVPVSQGGRHVRNETITLELGMRVINREDIADTHLRLAEIVAVIEDRFALDPGLDGLEGVIFSEVTDHNQTAHLTPEGPVGYGRIGLRIDARLH